MCGHIIFLGGKNLRKLNLICLLKNKRNKPDFFGFGKKNLLRENKIA
jgi:hypothetical protein